MPKSLSQVMRILRNTKIVEPLRKDPRTVGSLLLGLDPDSAREAIGWGQADFDKPVGTLTARDRVLLYAYWNQPRHLAELSEAFRQLYGKSRPSRPLIVVDLGCGPFTGGLALAGQLDSHDRFDYIGIDQSQRMRQLGEGLAASVESFDEMPGIKRYWAAEISGIRWREPPGWQPVIVIVSFLLASPTVDVKFLIAELEMLLAKLSFGETTVIYTNSPNANPNRNFPTFCNALLAAGFRLVKDEAGTVETERGIVELRYALFHRRRKRQLTLGGV